MLSIYNKALIRELNPTLLEELEDLEKKGFERTRMEKARNGQTILVLTEGNREYYLTSRYDPEYEAARLVDSYPDFNNDSSVIFYGVGMGYHIKEALRRYPEIKFFLVEPDREILYRFLQENELKELPFKNLGGIEVDFHRMEQSLSEFCRKFNRKNVVCYLKGYSHFFKKKRQDFQEAYVLGFKKEKDVRFAMRNLGEPIVASAINNTKEILIRNNLFWQDMEQFKGKTAILVAAGPSLDEEIENLRIIKEKKMAGIFAVGSAVNSLLAQDIFPDAVFSYDPTPENQRVLQQIKDRGITEIPLLFGTEIGYQSLEGYPGKAFSIFTDEVRVHNYFFKTQKELPKSQVGRTISVLAFDTLVNLGFHRIIFVGQNLGIKGEKTYSSGATYFAEMPSAESDQYSVEAKDVYGNLMRTASVYMLMKDDLEVVIRSAKDVEVYNSTKGGIQLKGAEFKELEELMKEMKEDSVFLFQGDEIREDYDLKHLEDKIKEVAVERDLLERYIANYRSILREIEKEAELGRYNRLQKAYIKLNLSLKRLEENIFSKLFVLSWKNMEYKNLVEKIEHFNEISDPKTQAQTIVAEFGGFLNSYEKAYRMLVGDYQKMEEAMKEYVEERKRR